MRVSVMLAALLLTSACGSKKEAPSDKSADKPTTETPATKPFSGPLTIEVVRGGAKIEVYTPDGKPAKFAAAMTAAKTMLGEPTHVVGTTHHWGVVEGDRCAFYTLTDKGGEADSPGTVTVPANDAECLVAAGKPAPAAGSGSGAAPL
jgi:hypothetical protein